MKIILIDIDGTLCRGDSWTPEECLNAKPIEENIAKVNELHKYNYIILYTARRDYLLPATLEWLRRNNVQFQAISNKKASAHVYIDNRAKWFDEIEKTKEDRII